MNPRTVCFCQPFFSMISTSVAPFFRWSRATTWAVLEPSRGPESFALVFLPLGRVLGRGGLLGRLPLRGRALGALCATRGLPSGLRLGRFRRGLGSFAQTLDALPNPGYRRLCVLELFDRGHSCQAVPDLYEAVRRPGGGQFRQLLLGGEGVEGDGSGGGGFLSAVISFCSLIVKIIMIVYPFRLRGHDIDHSCLLRKQGEWPGFFNTGSTLLKWSSKAARFGVGCRERRVCLCVPQPSPECGTGGGCSPRFPNTGSHNSAVGQEPNVGVTDATPGSDCLRRRQGASFHRSCFGVRFKSDSVSPGHLARRWYRLSPLQSLETVANG